MAKADAVHKLCNLYADRGRLDEAEEMYKRALEENQKALALVRRVVTAFVAVLQHS
jgi:tetratricopeptide (TPR) repeat protein